MDSDGNPLLYALKQEKGWHFASNKDRNAIMNQIHSIASKFAEIYPIGITVLVPSGNQLNREIANIVLSKSKNSELIEGVICKITTEAVDDIVMEDGSKFRQYYRNNFNAAYRELWIYLKEMNKKRNGYFSRHFIRNGEMRDILDFTLKASEDSCAEFANKINGCNILIVDDTISRGQTIKEACNIIAESYSPKSITVLTLLSKLYN
jgi:phosphoribosylpyrophosphate synthetase